MKFWLDEYATLDSPLHRWEPRYKLIALLTLIFAFAFVTNLWLIPAMVLITGVIFTMSRLPFGFLISRLRYPGAFLLMIVLIVPFLSGQTALFAIGPLTMHTEGVLLAIMIIARFSTILTVSLVLFGTSPFLHTVRAMYALGLPGILTDMVLFFYRYLSDLAESLATMQRAMRLRGFQLQRLNQQNLGQLAALAGTMLIRSQEQSERVYHAMLLRGYGKAPRPRDGFDLRSNDALALYGILMIAATIVLTNIVLTR
ncbi:MAG: cobalt ECF transporter T component CbiQ [Chloroflexota bacterium]